MTVPAARAKFAMSTLFLGAKVDRELFLQVLDHASDLGFDALEVSQAAAGIGISPKELAKAVAERGMTISGFAMGRIKDRLEYAKYFRQAYLTITDWSESHIKEIASASRIAAIHPHLHLRNTNLTELINRSKISGKRDNESVRWIFDTAHLGGSDSEEFTELLGRLRLCAVHLKGRTTRFGVSSYDQSRAMCLVEDSDPAYIDNVLKPFVRKLRRLGYDGWYVLEHNSIYQNWYDDMCSHGKWLSELSGHVTNRTLSPVSFDRLASKARSNYSKYHPSNIELDVTDRKRLTYKYYRDAIRQLQTVLVDHHLSLWSFDIGSQNLLLQEAWYPNKDDIQSQPSNVVALPAGYCEAFLLTDEYSVTPANESLWNRSPMGNTNDCFSIQIPLCLFGDISFPDHVLEILTPNEPRPAQLEHFLEAAQLVTALLATYLLEKRTIAVNRGLRVLTDSAAHVDALSTAICSITEQEVGIEGCSLFLRRGTKNNLLYCAGTTGVIWKANTRRVQPSDSPGFNECITAGSIVSYFDGECDKLCQTSWEATSSPKYNILFFPIISRITGQTIGVLRLANPYRRHGRRRYFSGIDVSVIQTLVANALVRLESLLEENQLVRQIKHLGHEIDNFVPQIISEVSQLLRHLPSSDLQSRTTALNIRAICVTTLLPTFNLRLFRLRDSRTLTSRHDSNLWRDLFQPVIQFCNDFICWKEAAHVSVAVKLNEADVENVRELGRELNGTACIDRTQLRMALFNVASYVLYYTCSRGVPTKVSLDIRLEGTLVEFRLAFDGKIEGFGSETLFEHEYTGPASEHLPFPRQGLMLWTARRICIAHGGGLHAFVSGTGQVFVGSFERE